MPDETKPCPQCGTRLKPDAPAGLCLRCLLSFGLKENAADPDAELPAPLPQGNAPAAGEFDRFRILSKIGEGGCGVVYRAEQLQPVRREVALKVIKLGMDTANVIARFEAERQALAMMDHPGIAKVFDAGSGRGGRPFFAMELVSGERITDYCDRKELSVTQRLELFARVCEAVQHAHQKGVIHRDLKPSNILVSEHDGLAQPKVIDFGIAKATSRQRLADQTVYTAFEQFLGTPAYMSPEQAGATGEDVDTRSDIYSLGVLLYELLTGRPPFEPERLRQAAVDEVFRIIRDEDPARPSARLTTLSAPELSEVSRRRLAAPPKLLREVRGDLDWVVMKALEKLPSRRYETASAFAAELRRHLNHEPISARPPRAGYRFAKMVRRNRLAFAAAVAVLVALIAGTVVSTWRFFKEQEARKAAVAAEGQAHAQAARAEQVARFFKEMLGSIDASVARGRDTALLREILDRTSARLTKELNKHPDIEADLLFTIGTAYFSIGELDKSQARLRRSLELRESVLSKTNELIARSLTHLANSLNARGAIGDTTEALVLARRAVAVAKARYGEPHADVVDALKTLGDLLWHPSTYAQSEAAYREAIAIHRKLGGSEAKLGWFLGVLSLLVSMDSNRLAEAEVIARESVQVQSGLDMPGLPMARSYENLASALVKLKRPAEAEAAIQQALDIRRKLQAGNRGFLALPLDLLGRAQLDQGKFVEAEASSREAVTLQIQYFGRTNRYLHAYMGPLVQALHSLKRWPEAEIAVRDYVDVCRHSDARKQALLHALHWQANIAHSQGKWAEMEAPLLEAIAECDRFVHARDKSTSPSLCDRLRAMAGESLLRQDKSADAEPLLQASYQALKDATNHLDVVSVEKSLHHLAELCDATGRPAEAAEWRRKLAEFQATQHSRTNSPAPLTR